TAALEEVLERKDGTGSLPEERERTAMLAFFLAQTRRTLRRELDLPHDALDHLADRLAEVADGADAPGEDTTHGLLFWPEQDFAELLRRWPALAEPYAATWDEHRAGVEGELVFVSETGAHATLLAASLDGHVAFAAGRGADPADPETHGDYLEHL